MRTDGIRTVIRDVFGIDAENPIADRAVTVTLSASDAIAVGSTLRMLAHTSPCGDALDRVGAALVKAGKPTLRVRGEKGCI